MDPGLLDAHAHLTDERFEGDLDAVIERARAAGIERIVTCGEDIASSEHAVALAERYDIVRAAVGIHPHRAASCDTRALERIRALAAHRRVVAIGEIGIDLSGRSAAPSEQERAFTAQLGLARELGLPACVHVRDAGTVVRSLVDRFTGVRGYVHCYSEGAEQVSGWMERGFLLSFAGTVTFPRSDALRRAAAAVPARGLLVETDAPYLAPQSRRGRRNEPAYVAHAYETVAGARGVAAGEIAARVRENAASLFGDRW